MNPETHILRPPNEAYAGRKGFPVHFTEPSQLKEPHDKLAALEAHRRAMFVLNRKKRTIPSFEKTKADIAQSNSLASNSEAIQAVKDEYMDDLRHLYEYQADSYHQEMMDRYLSNDESWYQPENTDKSTRKLQEILYNGATKDALLEAQWQGDHEHLRHAYISQLMPFQQERNELQKKQEEEHKRWEKAFPLSKEDFDKKARDVQLRAARFLVAAEHEKEKMLSVYGWAWRQVEPLQEFFKKDARFAADIRVMVMTDGTVSDPRRARMQ